METKLNLNKETIEGLQDLIAVNIDSAKGYKAAAEKVDNDSLSTLFGDFAKERERHAKALQSFVSWNGEEPEDDGSVRGSIHRAWLKARAAINSGDEEVVLIEATRGDEHIKSMYEDLLKDNPGNAMSDVLHRQYAELKADFDRISKLRELYD